ncbi:hypothetical protein ACRRTK_023883 [Alexandromys fortis]
MAYDRFQAVCHPLMYVVTMNERVCSGLVVISWALGISASLVNTFLLSQEHFCGPNLICSFACEVPPVLLLVCSDPYTTVISILTTMVLFGLGSLVLLLGSYSRIITTALGINSAKGRSKIFSSCSSHFLVVTIFYGSGVSRNLNKYSIHQPEKKKERYIGLGTLVLLLGSYSRIITTALGINSAKGRSKIFSSCSSHFLVVTIFYGSGVSRNLNKYSIHQPEQKKERYIGLGTLVLLLGSYSRIITTALGINSAKGRSKIFSSCSSHFLVVTIFYGSGVSSSLPPHSAHTPPLCLS